MRTWTVPLFCLWCALPARAQAQSCTPSRVLILLDKSSSMATGTIGGVSKWQIASQALDQVTTAYNESIEIGLAVFPDPNQCAPGHTVVSPARGAHDQIMAALGDPPPQAGNWTPMAQSLDAVGGDPALQDSGVRRFVLLLTDGWQWCSPYDPGTRFTPVAAVQRLHDAGISTYVVGFGSEVDPLTLGQAAMAGGTALPGCDPGATDPGAANLCYYRADSPGSLLDALMAIAVQVSAEICDGIDNNCDGQVDEGLTRSCGNACGAGMESCVAGQWTGCTAPMPQTEICDGADNNCDGTVDEGCACTSGDIRPCGGGGADGTGECRAGTQTCDPRGQWGGCEGAVGPAPEVCDGKDNNCDGQIDEDDGMGMLCPPGLGCKAGHCVPSSNPATGDMGGCGCRVAGRSGGSALDAAFLVGLVGLAALLWARRRG